MAVMVADFQRLVISSDISVKCLKLNQNLFAIAVVHSSLGRRQGTIMLRAIAAETDWSWKKLVGLQDLMAV